MCKTVNKKYKIHKILKFKFPRIFITNILEYIQEVQEHFFFINPLKATENGQNL